MKVKLFDEEHEKDLENSINEFLEGEVEKYACSGNRYWKMSMTPVIHKAISNKRLQKRGLLCPIDQYNKVHILSIG